jgi:hypothetical protein
VIKVSDTSLSGVHKERTELVCKGLEIVQLSGAICQMTLHGKSSSLRTYKLR